MADRVKPGVLQVPTLIKWQPDHCSLQFLVIQSLNNVRETRCRTDRERLNFVGGQRRGDAASSNCQGDIANQPQDVNIERNRGPVFRLRPDQQKGLFDDFVGLV